MEGRNHVLIDRPLTRFEEFIFKKNRDMLKPELVPGSSQGTMLEKDPDVEVVNPVIWGWWKPRFLLNHNLKTAYEWMWPSQQLAIVDVEHIDWDSMKSLPEDALSTLQRYSFRYPSFIRYFQNGIAEVKWQLIPDGRYYMDDDGYGMTGDIELNIYGFIDQEANIISKFHYYTDEELDAHVLDKIRKEVEKTMANKSNPK